MTGVTTPAAAARLAAAEALAQRGQLAEAEAALKALAADDPTNLDAPCGLAQMALDRGDTAAAITWLESASRIAPGQVDIQVDIGQLLLAAGDATAARVRLEQTVHRQPQSAEAWLVLARAHDALGAPAAALRARYEAVTRAQHEGRWTSTATTPPHLHEEVLHAVRAVRGGRALLFEQSLADLRDRHGPRALARIDEALAIYLGRSPRRPQHPQQQPRFLYVPDLPEAGYHDPYLHPWAPRLRAGFAAIRDEVASLLAEEQSFPGFIDLKPGERLERFVAGSAPAPSWEAYFFYRHGERYDEHHRRCPRTSAVLENIDLCRIASQAPEICFSILRPGSHILPHHGVTNARLVMHLPLFVPGDCALNLVGVGEHAWREGELVMFDDTYLHEAWNRSPQVRVIVLMDCWHPDLTLVEREAVARISALANTLRLAAARTDAAAPA